MEAFYGYGSEYGKKPVRRKRASPARKRRSPARKRRSPVRKCNSKMTLSNLRKLALENDVNIFSEAKTAISKRTGEPKKPKMVGCSTLMKRMNEAGLGYMYKVRQEYSQVDQYDPAYTPGPFSSVDQNVPTFNPLSVPQAVPLASPPAPDTWYSLEQQLKNKKLKKPSTDPRPPVPRPPPPLSTNIPEAPPHVIKGNCTQDKVNYTGTCVNVKDVPQKDCYGDLIVWDRYASPPVCVSRDNLSWSQWAIINGLELSDSVKQNVKQKFENPAGFGKRYVSGARPPASQKRVGEIIVKGRTHKVFKGKQGGYYYKKGKSGNKIYIDRARLRKH